MIDQDRFMTEMAILQDIHGRSLLPATTMAYYDALQWAREDGDLVIEAMVDLRKTEYMPKPFDIAQRVIALRTRRNTYKALPRPVPTEADIERARQIVQGITSKLRERVDG